MADIFDATGMLQESAGGGGGNPFEAFADQLSDDMDAIISHLDDIHKEVAEIGKKVVSRSGGSGAIPFALPLLKANPISVVGSFFKGFGSPFKTLTGGLGKMLDPLLKSLGVTASAAGMAGAALGVIVTVIGVFIGAILAAAAAVTAFVFVARHFVEMFDPALVGLFDSALRDLGATIGLIMTPVIQQAVRVIQAFSAQLFDAAGSFKGIGLLWKVAADVMIAWMPLIGEVLKLFGTLGSVLGEAVSLWSSFMLPIVRALVAVFSGLMASLRAAIPGLPNLGQGFKALGRIVATLIVVMAALVMSFLNMNAALGGMLGALNPPAPPVGLAAAQNARMVNVADIGKEALRRAFTASGRMGEGEDMDEAAFRKFLVDQVKAIQGGAWKKALAEVITDGVRGAMFGDPKKALQDIKNGVAAGPLGDVVNIIGQLINNENLL